MGFKRKIKRTREKKVLRKRRKELLEMLGTSKTEWKRADLRVKGTGLDAEPIPRSRGKIGKKPGLKSQYSVLWDLYQDSLQDNEFLEQLKLELDKLKEEEDVS